METDCQEVVKMIYSKDIRHASSTPVIQNILKMLKKPQLDMVQYKAEEENIVAQKLASIASKTSTNHRWLHYIPKDKKKCIASRTSTNHRWSHILYKKEMPTYVWKAFVHNKMLFI